MHKILLAILAPALLLSHASFAAQAYDTSLAQQQEALVLAEQTYVNCIYPELIAKKLKPGAIINNFQKPSKEICANAGKNFQDLLEVARNSTHPTKAFPLYQDILLGYTPKPGFLTAIQSPKERPMLKEIRLDPFTWETSIRSQLGVTGTALKHAGSDCPEDQDLSPYKSIANKTPYDQTMWHQMLFDIGYSCFAKVFKEFSLENNSDQGASQKVLEENIAAPAVELKAALQKKVKGVLFILFPQLAYDVPLQHLENVSVNDLRKGIQALGAEFAVVERVTVAPTETQVEVSEKEFRQIMKDNQGKKIVVIAKSYGGVIAREVLQRNRDLQSQISGVLFMGTTPFGSVIADYKSRADLFDEIYAGGAGLLGDLGSVAVNTLEPKVKEHFGQLRAQSLIRTNYLTMSSAQYPDFIHPSREAEDTVPVVSIVFLPPNLDGYFNGSKTIAGKDPSFLLMSMYGPTEGSAPIAGAAWDTVHSTRLFYENYDHLTFWELSTKEGIHLWYSALNAVLESDLIHL